MFIIFYNQRHASNFQTSIFDDVYLINGVDLKYEAIPWFWVLFSSESNTLTSD